MFSEFNTIYRKQINALNLLYQSASLPVYFEEDFNDDNSAHCRALLYINEPTSTEIGFNAAEQLTGFIQLLVKAPTSDSGINYSLNDIASQIKLAFPRSSFVEDDFKIEWLNVQREQPIRVDGHYGVTMRINYRAFYCA